MKNVILVFAVTAASFGFARDTNRYDRVETREGFTFSQRGGLGTSNEVVTAVSLEGIYDATRTNSNPSVKAAFSNAVNSVVEPVVYPAETDPFVSSWARKSDGKDAAKPSYTSENDAYYVSSSGVVTKMIGSDTNSIGTVTFELSLPRALAEAMNVSTNLVNSMTQAQKTRLLEAIVEYIRKKEGIPAPEVQ